MEPINVEYALSEIYDYDGDGWGDYGSGPNLQWLSRDWVSKKDFESARARMSQNERN
jgi:hypothetical protein